MAEQALAGLRVIEFADFTAAYAGRLLADLGAEVIKVEPPGGGHQRHTPPFLAGEPPGPDTSLAFWVHNTSKKSVVLDLDDPAGRASARALALGADVVLEDCTVGYLAARGLGYEELSGEKPSLVYTSVTGFGQSGPHAGYAYTDIVGQAMGGIMTLAGDPADPPNMIYGNQADVTASIMAAQGTLLAVLHADATGEGQLVDVSAQEALSISQETAMQTWDLQKRNRTRAGSRGMIPIELPGACTYETSDGHVLSFVLAPGGDDFPAVLDWMRERGMQEDLDDEPYASVALNLNMAWLTRIMGDPSVVGETLPALMHIQEVCKRFFASMTAVEAYEEGQGRRLLFGAVSTPRSLAENRQLRARDWYTTLGFNGRKVEFPGAPYRLSATPAVIGRPPRLGEHTAEVLAAVK
ncbi:MAG: CoA transferase [Dehalococcoidia bacterium]